jgi:hypothetical protein
LDKKGRHILENPIFGSPVGRRRDASGFDSKHSGDDESRLVYGLMRYVGNERGSARPSFHVQLLKRRTSQKHLRAVTDYMRRKGDQRVEGTVPFPLAPGLQYNGEWIVERRGCKGVEQNAATSVQISAPCKWRVAA